MFTATGLGEAHTWRLLPTRGFCLCAVQETLRAKEVAFRVSGDCSGCQDGRSCRHAGGSSLSTEGAPSPLQGHNPPWRPPPLSHGDVLCLSLPLSGLVGNVRLSEAPASPLWCQHCLSFLERLQGGCHQGPVAGARCKTPWLSSGAWPLYSALQLTSTSFISSGPLKSLTAVLRALPTAQL